MVQKVFSIFIAFWIFLYGFCSGLGPTTQASRYISSETIILCADGLGSVKTSNLCDYKADCNDASDELNLDLCKSLSLFSCGEKNQVMCVSRNRYDGNYDNYWNNRCTDIITACNVGPKCLSSNHINLCEEVANGRLKTPKFTEESSKAEKTYEDEEFHKLMNFIGEAMNETMKRNFTECPPLFIPFSDEKCISLFTPVQVSWSEAQMFCESITGSLVILEEVQLYIKLLKYIQEKGIKSRFWIGAKYEVSNTGNATNSEKTWSWFNGKSVTMGAPFWSLYSPGIPEENKQCQDNKRKLMPRFTGDAETCLAILEENFYYFSDEFCTTKLSPLCMTNKI